MDLNEHKKFQREGNNSKAIKLELEILKMYVERLKIVEKDRLIRGDKPIYETVLFFN